MTFGIKLQGLRKQAGMSQEALAGQLGVSRQAVSRWELDISLPETENIIKLAKIFDVSFDYLLNEEITEFTNTKVNDKSAMENKSKKLKITPLTAFCGLVALGTGFMSLTMFPTMIFCAFQLGLVGFDSSLLSSSVEMSLKYYSPLFLCCIGIFCLMIYIINKQRDK